MDLDLNPTQEMLRDSAKTFLQRSWSIAQTREALKSASGYSKDVWSEMADLGWLGVAVPEAYEGAGGNFVDQAVLLQEFGRLALTSPYLTSAVDSAYLLEKAGTEEQKTQYLTKMAAGEVTMALAYSEPNIDWEPSARETVARWEGDKLALNGTKLFVPYASAASSLLVVAKLADGKGLVAAVVDRGAAGVSVKPIPMSMGTMFDEVALANVAVPKAQVLSGVTEALLSEMVRRGGIAQSWYALGMGRRVLELAAEYAKVRVQFGNPIGAYQGIQHRLAEMLSYLDATEVMLKHAAWRLSEELPAEREVAMAKGYANEVTWKVLLDAHDVFGGVGYTVEHDLDIYSRLGVVTLPQYGNTEFHREKLAQVMGL